MPQVSQGEFEALPPRVHAFLADVPLHDVCAVDLPPARFDPFRKLIVYPSLLRSVRATWKKAVASSVAMNQPGGSDVHPG